MGLALNAKNDWHDVVRPQIAIHASTFLAFYLCQWTAACAHEHWKMTSAAGFYELLRDCLTVPGATVNQLSLWHQFVSGGFAGLTYWSLTYPTDVIKSSLQSDELQRSQRKYHGILDCARKLYRDEGGWKRFYRGFSPCMLRAIPANAVMLVVLENARQLLNRYI